MSEIAKNAGYTSDFGKVKFDSYFEAYAATNRAAKEWQEQKEDEYLAKKTEEAASAPGTNKYAAFLGKRHEQEVMKKKSKFDSLGLKR